MKLLQHHDTSKTGDSEDGNSLDGVDASSVTLVGGGARSSSVAGLRSITTGRRRTSLLGPSDLVTNSGRLLEGGDARADLRDVAAGIEERGDAILLVDVPRAELGSVGGVLLGHGASDGGEDTSIGHGHEIGLLGEEAGERRVGSRDGGEVGEDA